MKVAVSGTIAGQRSQVLMDGGCITGVGQYSSAELTGFQLIETSARILPGFIDIHVHGAGGADTMDATADAFEHICVTHAEHGTTALLLTTITESQEAIERALAAFNPAHRGTGAEIIGFHLEGPFIHSKKAGAQPKEWIQAPNSDVLERWMAIAQGTIRLMTLAPELKHSRQLIAHARKLGIVVSAGHSNATYDQAMSAFSYGVQSVTHLFNAMSELHHRDPGLVGAALDDRDVYTELIADNLHVHPSALRLALRLKGPDRVILITDAMSAACMPEGEGYFLGKQRVVVADGAVRLDDGRLAGSTLTLDRAVRNVIGANALAPNDIHKVTSQNQATLLGLPHGRLAPGAPANLVAVDDNWEVTHTFVRGKLVYRR